MLRGLSRTITLLRLAVHGAWAYTWDLIEGEALADRARVGLDFLVVAAAYHSVRAFAPRLAVQRVVSTAAGAYFEPDPELYGEIEPVVASLPGSATALARCRELAGEQGVDLRAWVVLTHSTTLGLRYSDHCVENAFGDRYVHALCPSSPAVRAYAAGLVADLARQGIRSFDLEAFGAYGYEHGSHHDKPRVDLSAPAGALLSICFCRWCIEAFRAAEVDDSALRHAVKAAIDTEIESPGGLEPATTFRALPDGARALEVRATATVELVAAIRAQVGADVELLAIGTAALPGLGDAFGAGDRRLCTHLDGLIVPVYGSDPGAAQAELESAREASGLPAAAALRFVAPDGGAGPLGQLMDAAADVGVAAFRHYHLGLATRAEVQALAEAIHSS